MIVHQFWHNADAPFPIFREYLRFSYDTVLWTPDTLPTYPTQMLKVIAPQVRLLDLRRHQANFIRYWALFEMGGVWLDIDVFPIKPLHQGEYPWVAAHGDSACVCAMSFPAGHPIMEQAFNEIHLLSPDAEASCVDVSGDGLLNRLLQASDQDVARRQLPFDARGHPIAGASQWAFHLYSTSGGSA